jgi:hypothetical protein
MKLITFVLTLTLLFTSVNIGAENKHEHHKSFKSYSSSVDKYHNSADKFVLPKEAPLNYYGLEFEDHFSTKGVIYNEIIPTTLPWLYIRLTKKPNLEKFYEYVETVILLLDTRKGFEDGRARIVMVIHERSTGLIFAALDKNYTDVVIDVDDKTNWSVLKNKGSLDIIEILRATIAKIQKDKFVHDFIQKTRENTI